MTEQLTETLHLHDLNVGDNGQVVGFEKGQNSYRRKLLSMGLTPGVTFVVTRYAPMGDPVEIRVRGFALTLRQQEARTLKVKKI